MKEQLWVWEYETEEGTVDMFMDLDEDIRIRVVEENFVDTLPTDGEHLTYYKQQQVIVMTTPAVCCVVVQPRPEGEAGAAMEDSRDESTLAPYSIIVRGCPFYILCTGHYLPLYHSVSCVQGSASESGLGLLSWWNG